jgi:hypothetical protein
VGATGDSSDGRRARRRRAILPAAALVLATLPAGLLMHVVLADERLAARDDGPRLRTVYLTTEPGAGAPEAGAPARIVLERPAASPRELLVLAFHERRFGGLVLPSHRRVRYLLEGWREWEGDVPAPESLPAALVDRWRGEVAGRLRAEGLVTGDLAAAVAADDGTIESVIWSAVLANGAVAVLACLAVGVVVRAAVLRRRRRSDKTRLARECRTRFAARGGRGRWRPITAAAGTNDPGGSAMASQTRRTAAHRSNTITTSPTGRDTSASGVRDERGPPRAA